MNPQPEAVTDGNADYLIRHFLREAADISSTDEFMTNTRAEKVLRYLPSGMVFFFITAFACSNSDPTLDLIHFDIPYAFVIGCSMYAILVFTLLRSIGSIDEVARLLSRRPPSKGIYIFYFVCLVSLGIMWGGTFHYAFAIFEKITATNEFEMTGNFRYYLDGGLKAKCHKIAVISTSYGDIEPCVFGHSGSLNAGIFMPEKLSEGDSVKLRGLKSSTTFILKNVSRLENNHRRRTNLKPEVLKNTARRNKAEIGQEQTYTLPRIG